jgi:two-component system, sensor histidine kinase LadS
VGRFRVFYRFLIVSTLCVLPLLLVNAQANTRVVSLDLHDPAPLSLTEYFVVLEDASQALTFADILQGEHQDRFTKPPSTGEDAINFSYSKSAFWLRLTLHNRSETIQERMLEIGKSRLSSVQMYQPDAAGNYRSWITGDLQAFDARPYKNRFFVFPVTLAPHSEQVLYLRVQSESAIFIPARLWPTAAFYAYERSDYFAQALYFGMATGMILFNLLLFIALRDVIYLLYVGFSSTMAFALAAQNGLIKEFLPIDSPLFWSLHASFGFSLAVVTFLWFMRHMLKTWETIPRFDRWLKALLGLNLLFLPGFIIALPSMGKPAQMLYLVSMVVIMGVGLFCALRRQRSAYFFVAAFAILFVSGVVTSLAGLGVLPANFVTMNALQFGSAMEMLLLAFALADRFIIIRREKEKAQKEALEAQLRLVENLKTTERVLEERVAQRTAELQASNDTLACTLDDLQLTQQQLQASEKLALQGQRLATQALAEQRQFMDMLNHELKTPMSVLRISLEMENPGASAKHHAVQALKDMDAIVERCLQADQLDHHQLAPQKHPCHIKAMLVELCTISAAPQRIAIASAETMPEVETDYLFLHIILSNLIDNALKYGALDQVIKIHVQPHEQAGRPGIVVRVINVAGSAGVPDPDRVFEKYYRSPRAHGKTGSGLGLYLVKRMAELLEGSIRYHFNGTEVNFELWIPY